MAHNQISSPDSSGPEVHRPAIRHLISDVDGVQTYIERHTPLTPEQKAEIEREVDDLMVELEPVRRRLAEIAGLPPVVSDESAAS